MPVDGKSRLLGSIGQSTWPAHIAPPSPDRGLPRDDLHHLVRELPEQLRDPDHRAPRSRRRSSSSSSSPRWSPRAAGSGWVKRVTGPNGKSLFTVLFILWAVVFGVGLQLVPHEGASSPYGGLGLIALFSGFFISMGLLWSVIGD